MEWRMHTQNLFTAQDITVNVISNIKNLIEENNMLHPNK